MLKLKTTIICFIVIMLLSISTITYAENNNEKNINNIDTSNIAEIDVPTWSEDDTWTYKISLEGSYSVLNFDWDINNLKFTVEQSTSSSYKVNFQGAITGSVSVEDTSISGTLKDTSINGDMYIEQSTLGYESIDMHIDGKLTVTLIPIPMQIDITMNFNPTFVPMAFPISVGKIWDIEISDIDIDGTFKLIGSIELPLDTTDWVGGGEAECISMESKTVDAGTYEESYKIISNQDITEKYYTPAVGNVIKAIGDTFTLDKLDIELKSASYSGGGENPNTPSKPNGPTTIRVREQFTYSTSTSDPQGNQVYYWFDWGDNSNSGWLGPYDSGDTATSTHTWNNKGTYNVKVKAKDTEDHESKWSQTLSVSTPKNKNIEKIRNFILIIIQYIKEKLSIFDKTLQKQQ